MGNKLSIIGRGTVGCLTALKFSNEGFDIDWYQDPHIQPLSVGEGADLSLPHFLQWLFCYFSIHTSSIFHLQKAHLFNKLKKKIIMKPFLILLTQLFIKQITFKRSSRPLLKK